MQSFYNKKFINYGYNSFINEWHDYYKNNYLTFFEEVENLKHGLSSSCKISIDRFIDTIISKLATPSGKYLIKKDFLFSEEDIKIIKNETLNKNEIQYINNKYKINSGFLLQTSVFKYHNGLKKLPKHIQRTIYNGIILDGGAYYGDSSLVFTKYKPNHIYSFEPNTINFSHLKQTIKDNSLSNYITPINKGLYSKNINIAMQFNSLTKPNLGAKLTNKVFKNFKKNNAKKEKIELITIDSFTESNNLNDISLIKLDIEGAALEAIIGVI